MAQTRRKRQTKHRGNAAGVVEARGRTGRPPSAEERKREAKAKARADRLNSPPTWKGAYKRAAVAGGFMFLFLLLVSPAKGGNRLESALVFAVLATALYAPGGYYLEMFLFKRRMAKRHRQ